MESGWAGPGIEIWPEENERGCKKASRVQHSPNGSKPLLRQGLAQRLTRLEYLQIAPIETKTRFLERVFVSGMTRQKNWSCVFSRSGLKIFASAAKSIKLEPLSRAIFEKNFDSST